MEILTAGVFRLITFTPRYPRNRRGIRMSTSELVGNVIPAQETSSVSLSSTSEGVAAHAPTLILAHPRVLVP